ncbi:MAG: glycosyltransferase [Eubacteriales bacterium]|nr:glycosyltransferase [Eubacteriales bacterium]
MKELLIDRIESRLHNGTQISVIIPAHNAEKTLRRAVESVCRAMDAVAADAVIAARLQGDAAPLFEILVVENGSTDGTEFLARTLELEHPGTVWFLRSGKGVSNARNRGLEAAAGEWVLFLDADDYLLEGAGEVLRRDLYFTGTDLIVHSYEAGRRIVHICRPSGERYFGEQTEEISVRMIENPTRYTAVWGKLYRRDCIERNHLRFDPLLRLSEDSHFLIRYLAVCRRIRLFDLPLYHYSTDNASVVRTWDGKKEEGYRDSLEAVQRFLRTRPAGIRAAGAGYGMMQFNLLMVREVFSKDSPYTLPQKIRRMKEIKDTEPFAAAFREFDPKRHRGAGYLPIRMLRIGAYAAAAAVYEARVLQNACKELREKE